MYMQTFLTNAKKKNSLKRHYYAYSNHELILKHLIHVTATIYCCPTTVLTIWRSNLHSTDAVPVKDDIFTCLALMGI